MKTLLILITLLHFVLVSNSQSKHLSFDFIDNFLKSNDKYYKFDSGLYVIINGAHVGYIKQQQVDSTLQLIPVEYFLNSFFYSQIATEEITISSPMPGAVTITTVKKQKRKTIRKLLRKVRDIVHSSRVSNDLLLPSSGGDYALYLDTKKIKSSNFQQLLKLKPSQILMIDISPRLGSEWVKDKDSGVISFWLKK